MAYVVQAKSQDLTDIQKSFATQQESIEGMQKDLLRMNERLKQGWMGRGSEKFFQEQDQKVMPAVARLVKALGEASHTVGQVTGKLAAADREGAAPLNPANANGAGIGAA